jgi:hypothetical protein
MNQQREQAQGNGEPVIVPFAARATQAPSAVPFACAISLTLAGDEPVHVTLTLQLKRRCDDERFEP